MCEGFQRRIQEGEREVSVVESVLLSSLSSPSFPSCLYACIHLSLEFMVLHVWLRTVEGGRELWEEACKGLKLGIARQILFL